MTDIQGETQSTEAMHLCQKQFSWKRVATLVSIVMLLVAPAIVYLESTYGRGLLAQQNKGVCRIILGESGSSPFDLSQSVISTERIRSGGPGKDGIPAISDPKLIASVKADYLRKNDRVIGVALGEEVRAYPLRILNYHEIVNDRIGDTALAVTYCPLCDSAAVFDRKTPLGEREFGVSGLLYNSNVLLYDRTEGDESLWSQALVRGISGPGANVPLRGVPLELTTWEDWLNRYPSTKVLSPDTGYPRSYEQSPYGDYMESERLMFPVDPKSDRLPTKERVLAVWHNQVSKVYPVSEFSSEHPRVEDSLDGKHYIIDYNPVSNTLRVEQAEDGVQWMYSFWFAWHAMHPESEVYFADE